jgi:tetratricopeptide (TPR) repeat protein
MRRSEDHGDWCPRETEALAYASGELSEEAVSTVEAHLSECVICRETVAAMTTLVLPAETPDEAAAAARLDGASIGPVRDILDEHLGRVRREGGVAPVVPFPKRGPGKAWWLAAAAAIVVVVGGVVWQRPTAPNEAHERGNKALASALRDGRPFEYRLSGTPYAPYEAVRSGGPSDRRDRLEAARTSLALAAKEESTPEVRKDYGRALAAAGDCPAAVDQLRQASAANPKDVATLVDLAVAMACAGDAAGARGVLDRALTIEPGNAEALFNRALIAKRAGDEAAARADVEAYSRIDTSSPWAAEIRETLTGF